MMTNKLVYSYFCVNTLLAVGYDMEPYAVSRHTYAYFTLVKLKKIIIHRYIKNQKRRQVMCISCI